MPKGVWSAKRERMYEHVKASCLERAGTTESRASSRVLKRCKAMAAATTNATRTRFCETKACRKRGSAARRAGKKRARAASRRHAKRERRRSGGLPWWLEMASWAI